MKKWKYQKRSKPCPHCTLWGENGPLVFEVRKIILESEIKIILNNIIRLLNESVHFSFKWIFWSREYSVRKFASWLHPPPFLSMLKNMHFIHTKKSAMWSGFSVLSYPDFLMVRTWKLKENWRTFIEVNYRN